MQVIFTTYILSIRVSTKRNAGGTEKPSSPEDLDILHKIAVYRCFEQVTAVASLQEDGASWGAVAEAVRFHDVLVPIIG